MLKKSVIASILSGDKSCSVTIEWDDITEETQDFYASQAYRDVYRLNRLNQIELKRFAIYRDEQPELISEMTYQEDGDE